MRRGEVWTVSGGNDYAGKPRPVVIVQDDRFDSTDSLTVCLITSNDTSAPLFRIPLKPKKENGLKSACRVMVDKVTTVPRAKVGKKIGVLSAQDVVKLNRLLVVFLGVAGSKK
ncbi:MAG: type II toxin-antitoxin system PemK/MazF family toxin [Cytophagaceae bacterium]|nr:MAG: type II toxin-antitoxin system PemK/MazF family toxin [Cytophagaceae bacterium]